MKLPFMSRRAFERAMTGAMQDYRWERDMALDKARHAEARANKLMDELVRPVFKVERNYSDYTHTVLIKLDVSDRLALAPNHEIKLLSDRIASSLIEYKRDHSDMRDMRAPYTFQIGIE